MRTPFVFGRDAASSKYARRETVKLGTIILHFPKPKPRAYRVFAAPRFPGAIYSSQHSPMDTSRDEAYPPRMTLSARNRIEGKVIEIQLGGVMAHVVIRAGNNLIESVITKRSADEMKLKVGDTVSAVIKSTEVMLEKA